MRGLGEKEIPRGYWTHIGVWLNFILAIVALALAVHFVTSAQPPEVEPSSTVHGFGPSSRNGQATPCVR